MKENNGRAARRKQAKRLMSLAGGCVTVCFVVSWLSPSSSSSSSSSSAGRQRGLRQTDQAQTRQRLNEIADSGTHQAAHFRKVLAAQFAERDEGSLLEDVLHGKLNLIDIQVVEEDLLRAPANSYEGVYGAFCKLEWDLHKKDPSGVPMFRDLVAKSPDCQNKDPYLLDIRKIAQLIIPEFEEHHNNNNKEHSSHKLLNVTAAVFHESRCGSTLVANNLIAMDPAKHRVYSESAPAAAAIKNVCGEHYTKCSEDQAVEIFRDVIRVMSLTDNHQEERVFFKFQSITTKALNVFQQAFPHVPWMFIYRDPVQVMMSHVKDTGDLSRAICTRTKTQHPPRDVQAIAHAHDTSVSDMSLEEYCAAHLAGITEAAVRALQQNAMGIPVDYATLPDSLWESIMPQKVLGRPLSQEEITNMETVSHQYSKGRGAKHVEFEGDSEKKEQMATPAIQRAAKEFLQESFDQLAKYESPKVL